MSERPYAKYTREKTWAALYSQHINAGYALVPYSATNNSIAVIRCKSPDEVAQVMADLLAQKEACRVFYASRQTPDDKAPAHLSRARHAVILAKSSDYHRYHLADHTEFKLVVCGLHDSYLHLPVLEMNTNKRYTARETAVAITSPEFTSIRCTPLGHNILIGALINGDKNAISLRGKLPTRTQYRLKKEVENLREKRYQGRPLAFLTDAEREAIGSKISEGLKRYYERRLKVV